MEIWKHVIGYEGLYEASNLGRIKSLGNGKSRNSKIRILKQSVYDKYGHSRVFLFNKGIGKGYITSRLVALHFIPNPLNLPLVCHKDETLDENGALYNGADNLFWGTYSDNMKDMYNKGRGNNFLNGNTFFRGKFGKDHPTSKPVNQYSISGDFIKTWGSTMDIKRELLIGNSSITQCCKGNRKSSGGFIWKYKI